MKLTAKDLEVITGALAVMYMNDDERFDIRQRCRELHDRIQVIRKNNKIFESVE